MHNDGRIEARSDPRSDGIFQRSVCAVFGVSERTGSLWARQGKLRRFEHGIPGCGRRKYSRTLVERELQRRWENAVQAQEASLAEVNA